MGASKTYAFWKVILPDIMPGVLTGFLLAFTMSLDDFVITHFTKGVGNVSKVSELKKPDLIIIPGTKNTISDMKGLRESGLETSIKKLVSENIPAFGICGGYQIMGKKIELKRGSREHTTAL